MADLLPVSEEEIFDTVRREQKGRSFVFFRLSGKVLLREIFHVLLHQLWFFLWIPLILHSEENHLPEEMHSLLFLQTHPDTIALHSVLSGTENNTLTPLE